MLAAAVSHPTRTQCFTILGERVASPAEIARQLRADVTNVGYHIRALRAWGLIEQVDERPVRGSVEHFYRAVQNPEISDEEEATLDAEERRHFAETILSFYAADAIRSLDTELLYARTDHCLTRYVYDVDEEGWDEAVEAYRQCWARIKEIQVSAAERLEKKKAEQGEEKPVRMLSYLSLFELPSQDP
jgi:DNA-binding transcriptional ArsR family regulator